MMTQEIMCRCFLHCKAMLQQQKRKKMTMGEILCRHPLHHRAALQQKKEKEKNYNVGNLASLSFSSHSCTATKKK